MHYMQVTHLCFFCGCFLLITSFFFRESRNNTAAELRRLALDLRNPISVKKIEAIAHSDFILKNALTQFKTNFPKKTFVGWSSSCMKVSTMFLH